MNPTEADDQAPLEADRELTLQEQEKLKALGKRGWKQVLELLAQKAKETYGIAPPTVFTQCYAEHMSEDDHEDMVKAEVYTCPQCATLLKDRKSRVASGILLERKRIADLWLDVEQAKFEDFDARFDRFRRALGLSR